MRLTLRRMYGVPRTRHGVSLSGSGALCRGCPSAVHGLCRRRWGYPASRTLHDVLCTAKIDVRRSANAAPTAGPECVVLSTTSSCSELRTSLAQYRRAEHASPLCNATSGLDLPRKTTRRLIQPTHACSVRIVKASSTVPHPVVSGSGFRRASCGQRIAPP